MRKLLKFSNNKFVVSEGVYFSDNADDPVEEYDISVLNDNEFEKLKKNPNDKKILDKVKKLKFDDNL